MVSITTDSHAMQHSQEISRKYQCALKVPNAQWKVKEHELDNTNALPYKISLQPV